MKIIQYPKGSEWQRKLLEATFRFSSTLAIIYGLSTLTRKILSDFPQVWVLFATLVAQSTPQLIAVKRCEQAKKQMIRALLTSIICGAVFFVPNLEQGIHISPLIFGFAVSSVNYRKFKINPLAGVGVFIALSYVFCILSIFLIALLEIYINVFLDQFKLPFFEFTVELFLVLSGLLCTIILYRIYSVFLKNQKKIFGLLVIVIIYILIPFTVWLVSKDNNYTQNEDFVIFQIFWMIFMGLGFGIAINQLEIKREVNKMINMK